MKEFSIEFMPTPLSEESLLIGSLQLSSRGAQLCWISLGAAEHSSRIDRIRDGFNAKLAELTKLDRPLTPADFIQDKGLSIRLVPIPVIAATKKGKAYLG